jgi:hypothetical protein
MPPKRAFEVGDHIWVKATAFDTADDKWSEANFGNKGKSTLLLGRVESLLNNRELRVYFFYDRTSMEIAARSCNHLTDRHEIVQNVYVRKLTRAEARALRNDSTEESSSGSESESDADDTPVNEGDIFEPEWTFETITADVRMGNYQFEMPSIRNRPEHWDNAKVETSLVWQLWKHFFPHDWAVDHIIEFTNQSAADDASWSKPLTIGELYIFLGLVCYMIVFPAPGERRNHWKNREPDSPFPFADLGRCVCLHYESPTWCTSPRDYFEILFSIRLLFLPCIKAF